MLEQARSFGDHRFKAPAAERAAILRDDAEAARVVAALGNLDVGEVARRGEHPRREVVIEVGNRGRSAGTVFRAFAQCNDALELVGTHQRIHFRHLLADIAAVAFHQAAGDNQLSRAAGFLVLGHLQNGVDGFLLGGVDEAAGVHHQHVGVAGMGRQLVAASHEGAHHDFAIDEIFGTAQTDKTDFQACVRNEG